MNGRKIITGALLAFILASVGYLVFKEQRAASGDVPTGAGDAESVEAGGDDQASARKLVVYYFHTTKRCNTCRAIERQAKEAIETGFSEALMAGRLEWREVNLDEPGQGHFVTDFQVTGSSLVLADTVGGKVSRFKVLQKVWNLVANPAEFATYVQGETTSWLEGS